MEKNLLLQQLDGGKAADFLEKMYGKDHAKENKNRYLHVMEGFVQAFKNTDMYLFTSAGRTEISGNHTDHNHGKVLAGSINLDCVAAAAANGTDEIHIISETYNQRFTIRLDDLSPSEKMAGTIDLTKGMLMGFQEMGYRIGGFDAFITSNVISAAGVSSSASYEMLICSMINTFFNGNKVDVVTYAHVGKYAENKYWNKASGLLDQMACAVGNLVAIDFLDPGKPAIPPVAFDFAACGHALCIVDSRASHADLTDEYTAYNNGHLALADPLAAARNFLNAIERIPSIIDQYKAKNEVLEREIPQLQEIAGKVWKKEEELKQLKSELAALDRKIQLELAPPTPEITEKEHEGQQVKPEAKGVRNGIRQYPEDTSPQIRNPSESIIANHTITGHPGLYAKEETRSKGLKI